MKRFKSLQKNFFNTYRNWNEFPMEFDGYKYHNYISTDQDWLVIVS